MTSVWRLQILMGGGTVWKVTGTEEVLRTAYDEIRDYFDRPEGSGQARLVSAVGFTDSADRAESSISVVLEHVQAVDLTKMY